jgi:hypothetical protein
MVLKLGFCKKVTYDVMRILTQDTPAYPIHIRIRVFYILDRHMAHGPHVGEVCAHDSQWQPEGKYISFPSASGC